MESSTEKEKRWITDSLNIASTVLSGETRGDGSPFMGHLISVAEIVALEIGLAPSAIAAFFLHEASRTDSSVLIQNKKYFSQEILSMSESLNKISTIKPKDTGLEAENYRKLIISYSKDPRVTLIKLADRLEVMRRLDIFTKSKQLRKATETQLLYAPLAHQLGLYNIKSEFEDLSFKFIDPDNYRTITNKLKAGEQERKRLVDLFIKPVETELKSSRISYKLKSRTKGAYSIHKKMVTQQIPFESIADLFAIRIIIDSPPEQEQELCWKVYSIVTEKYIPDSDRLRDWITVPKESGYESLHTTVKTRENNTVEVQIRTKRMDEIAESGYAAHWAYKGVKSEERLSNWLVGVKKLLESGERIDSSSKEMDLTLDEIFVFTPDGDLRRLKAGASVLDFAFDIHSNLGVKCSGAKVNGKAASIRERLKTGDVVEIMSSKNQKPSSDWLNYVVTSKARARIKQKLNEEVSKRALEGRELLERRLNNWKLEFNDEVISFLLKNYKLKTAAELYVDIANEAIDTAQIKSLLFARDKETYESREVTPPVIYKPDKGESDSSGDYLIIDDKVRNVGYKLAKCCNPIMGDDIFGFVTIKEGIKIHRMNCPNAARLLENYPYRIHKVKWREGATSQNFQVILRVSGYEESSISQKIVEVIGMLNISLRNLSITEERGLVEVRLVVLVTNNQQLDKLVFNIRKIKTVKSVTRISN